MKNKVLVYDDSCPFCTWYSGLFVKFGFLNSESRKAFSEIDESLLSKIDFDKSRNEIPLLDTSTNNVVYGIDALLGVLDRKLPFVKIIGNFAPVKWILKKLYKLLSYNRKIIVAKKCGPGKIDCAPDNNYRYRFVFMAICLVFTTVMLYPLQHNLFNKLTYYHLDINQLQTAHFAFVIINCSLAFTFSKANGYNYIGQVNMLAMSVTLLLLPVAILNNFFFSEFLSTLWLILTAVFIFKEYIRRMEYAGVLSNNKWIVSMNLLSLTGFILFLFH
jgi:predicted DCC family thiol-disulfide oxidoreductase YuxK